MSDLEIGYKTALGKCVCGDSLYHMRLLDDASVNLIITSPPFALQRQKEYGNENQKDYIEWLCQFAKLAFQKLRDDGSFVIDIGGAYEKGVPSYSLYQFKALIHMCDDIGFHLAQPFYWHNPSALPAPTEWVNKRKLRAKSSVNTVWWLCKDPLKCKADITKVLSPYSSRMKRFISKPEEFVKNKTVVRPSGHMPDKVAWTRDNGGSIPPNLLQISNSESNSQYLRYCKLIGVKGHPARFPTKLPEFFIKFLTDEGDIVIDIFSGSNTTGDVAEKLRREWRSFEISREYVAISSFRFAADANIAKQYYTSIMDGGMVEI